MEVESESTNKTLSMKKKSCVNTGDKKERETNSHEKRKIKVLNKEGTLAMAGLDKYLQAKSPVYLDIGP